MQKGWERNHSCSVNGRYSRTGQLNTLLGNSTTYRRLLAVSQLAWFFWFLFSQIPHTSMNYYLPALSSQLSSETISRWNPTENKPMFCLYDQPQHFGSQWVERPSAPQHFGKGLRQRNERSWFQYNSSTIQVT
jgi:hypothetical protein